MHGFELLLLLLLQLLVIQLLDHLLQAFSCHRCLSGPAGSRR
jgi:hypothetical protein